MSCLVPALGDAPELFCMEAIFCFHGLAVSRILPRNIPSHPTPTLPHFIYRGRLGKKKSCLHAMGLVVPSVPSTPQFKNFPSKCCWSSYNSQKRLFLVLQHHLIWRRTSGVNCIHAKVCCRDTCWGLFSPTPTPTRPPPPARRKEGGCFWVVVVCPRSLPGSGMISARTV